LGGEGKLPTSGALLDEYENWYLVFLQALNGGVCSVEVLLQSSHLSLELAGGRSSVAGLAGQLFSRGAGGGFCLFTVKLFGSQHLLSGLHRVRKKRVCIL
jgi:hypothetical protein